MGNSENYLDSRTSETFLHNFLHPNFNCHLPFSVFDLGLFRVSHVTQGLVNNCLNCLCFISHLTFNKSKRSTNEIGRWSVDLIIRAILTIFHCFTQAWRDNVGTKCYKAADVSIRHTVSTLARLNDIRDSKGLSELPMIQLNFPKSSIRVSSEILLLSLPPPTNQC